MCEFHNTLGFNFDNKSEKKTYDKSIPSEMKRYWKKSLLYTEFCLLS